MTGVTPLRCEQGRLALRTRAWFRHHRDVHQGVGKKGHTRLSAGWPAAVVVVLGLFCLVAPVPAQEGGPSNLVLISETPPQEWAARAVNPSAGEGACPDLVRAFNNGQIAAGSRQEDLLVRCRELVLNANQRADLDNTRNGLQSMAPEEAATQGTNAIETSNAQFANLGARLAALRGGATGISLRRFALQIDQPAPPGTLVASLLPYAAVAGSVPAATPSIFKRLGIFANGTISFGDKDATDRESGFDFDTLGVTAGIDYRLTQNFILGFAFGYMSTDVDLDQDGGGLDSDGYSISTYATFYVDRFYVDGIVSFGWNDYDIDRTIRYSLVRELNPDGTPTGDPIQVDQTAHADSDGNWYAFSFGVGYDFQAGGLTIGPIGRVNYTKGDIDGYQEEIDNMNPGYGLILDVDSQNIVSLTSVLGVDASYAISTPWGVLLPQVRFEWEHEFENDSRTITAFFVDDPTRDETTQFRVETDDPDRDFFNIAAGLSATFARGVSAFFQYETILGLDDITVHNFAFGVRLEL